MIGDLSTIGSYEWTRQGVHGQTERSGKIVVVADGEAVIVAGLPPVLEPVEARWLAARLQGATGK